MKKILTTLLSAAIILFCAAPRWPVPQLTLAWDAPPDYTPELYTLYQNDVPIADVPSTQTTFSFYPPREYGWFTYYVTAWKDGIESAPSNILTAYVWKSKGQPIFSIVQ